MKVSLKVNIEFESWFENKREPKTKEQWADFFKNYLMPESSIIGVDDGEYQDMIAMSNYDIKCENIHI
jgi:hypothetical protein